MWTFNTLIHRFVTLLTLNFSFLVCGPFCGLFKHPNAIKKNTRRLYTYISRARERFIGENKDRDRESREGERLFERR